MPSLQKLNVVCEQVCKSLENHPVVSYVTASIFIYGVEELMELKLSCPCSSKLSAGLISSIFIGPFLFIFAIMFILFKLYKYCQFQCCCCKKSSDNSCFKVELDFWKALGHCLILPCTWVIILFLDGDYLACCLTYWEGQYVFDKDIKKMWCQPTELAYAGNKSDLQHEYRRFISTSQLTGYVLLGAYGLLITVIVTLSYKNDPENAKGPVAVKDEGPVVEKPEGHDAENAEGHDAGQSEAGVQDIPLLEQHGPKTAEKTSSV